jgi:hypothetical protein
MKVASGNAGSKLNYRVFLTVVVIFASVHLKRCYRWDIIRDL